MNKRLLAMAPLALALAQTAAVAQQPETQTAPRAARPAPRPTFAESVRRNLQRLGATVDEARSRPDMIVSGHVDEKGAKTTVVIVNDRRNNLLGFYIYNFGNLKNAPRREDVYRYLLSANDAITIGSFFVDGEEDIGYKYLVSGWQPPTPASFEAIYRTMLAVARERRQEIRDMLAGGRQEPAGGDGRAPEGRPPGR